MDWLLDGPIRFDDGMLAAWAEGSRPAHVYEESTGYLITLLCFLHQQTGDERYAAEAGRTVRALVEAMGEREGCGRDGVLYLFDTVVCLRALAAFFSEFPAAPESRESGPARTLSLTLVETARKLVERRAACTPPGAGHDDGVEHWSSLFNVHLIKALSHLSPWPGPWDVLAGELVSRWYSEGRFWSAPRGDRVYLHTHCYALEGVLGLHDMPREVVAQATDFLAEAQTASGGIPSWWSAGEEMVLATDATAQAVRLWLLTDCERFEDNIRKGMEFMLQMLGPGGGVLYAPGLAHENSWTTIFTVQAMIWQDVQPDPSWLI